MTEIILESISDGVFTVDDSWRITSFNKAAEKITGIDRKQAIGKLCHEVFKSNMCEEECPLRRTMKTGKTIIDKKGYCVNFKGQRIPISVSTALLIDADGKVSGGAETFRDLREIEELKEKLQARAESESFTSHSPLMQKIYQLLPAIAESTSTVLIDGETGTGKELMTKAIHKLSGRSKGPLIAVNCGALPDSLLESELFGYKKGAFTGADKDKAGRFKLAQNGTLFLDEIGDISQALQVKLLRVLQEREYEALGSNQSEKTNARIICATNKNLKELVDEGKFRQDLYYRINVITISMPPLRDRKEDIPQLAEHFLHTFNLQTNKSISGFTPECYAAFYAYAWPGNIRELENVVERAVVLCGTQVIDIGLLPPEMTQSEHKGPSTSLGAGTDMATLKKETEKRLIQATLAEHKGKCSTAAHELGIDKATLYRKIKAYGIDIRRT